MAADAATPDAHPAAAARSQGSADSTSTRAAALSAITCSPAAWPKTACSLQLAGSWPGTSCTSRFVHQRCCQTAGSEISNKCFIDLSSSLVRHLGAGPISQHACAVFSCCHHMLLLWLAKACCNGHHQCISSTCEHRTCREMLSQLRQHLWGAAAVLAFAVN